MSKARTRTYSRYTQAAATLLGALVRAARKQRGLTEQDLATRAGISRGLLSRIEKGELRCELGAAFEVASIVGLKLFDADEPTLARRIQDTDEKLALLPKSVRKERRVVNDDF